MSAALNIPKPTPLKHRESDVSAMELGKILRGKRKVASISLDTAAQETNIAADYIVALEMGDWSVLPGEVYARGYIKKYAQYLGIEAQSLRGHLQPATITHEPIKTPVLQSHSAPMNLKPYIILAGLILAGFALGALFANIKADTKKVSAVKPIPDTLRHYITPDTAPFYRYSCLQKTSGLWSCYFGEYMVREQNPSYISLYSKGV